jgi:3-deoxy-7-phosphoheptulonate synthase
MVIILQPAATEADVTDLQRRLQEFGYQSHLSRGEERTIVGAVGAAPPNKPAIMEALERLTYVERVVPITRQYKLAAREFNPHGSRFEIGRGVTVGGESAVVIAGPCSVEGEEQIVATARAVRAAGAQMLRGGAFKPRTGPYHFQGLGDEGLRYLAAARAETGLPIVTEVLDPRDVERVAETADVLQLGARNMQNFTLLREVGRGSLPVLLKRGLSATYDEWLQAAEYLLSEGNRRVMLCERGIRTFESHTRNCLDLAAVPAMRELSHLPIIVDPSHGTGRSRYVAAMAKAAIAAGADGLMIEVHIDPHAAWTDAAQAIDGAEFGALMSELAALGPLCGRPLHPTASPGPALTSR